MLRRAFDHPSLRIGTRRARSHRHKLAVRAGETLQGVNGLAERSDVFVKSPVAYGVYARLGQYLAVLGHEAEDRVGAADVYAGDYLVSHQFLSFLYSGM